MSYLLSGQKVEVVEKISQGYVVNPYIEVMIGIDEIDIELSGEHFIVDRVFDSPPVSHLSKKINALNEKISEKRGVIMGLRNEQASAEKESEAFQSKLKSYPALRNLLDFINGDFDYFVTPDDYSGNYLHKKDGFLSIDNSCDRGQLRLLSLYGRSKNDLEWKINRYSDGSGSDTVAIPCKTLEDAILVIRNHFESEIRNRVKANQYYGLISKTDWLQANGFAVENNVLTSINNYEIERIEKSIADNKRYKDQYSNKMIADIEELSKFKGVGK